MNLILRLIFICLITFPVICFSQVDQHKLDSLQYVIDSKSRMMRQFQDSFLRVQESLYLAQQGIVKMKKKETSKENNKNRNLLIGGMIFLLLFIITAVILKKRKKTT